KMREIVESISPPKADRGGEFVRFSCDVKYERQWYLDQRIGGVCNHMTRAHMVQDLFRYMYVSCYGTVHGRSPELPDFPRELLPDHANVGRAMEGHFDDRFRVQLPDRPSTTITSHLAK